MTGISADADEEDMKSEEDKKQCSTPYVLSEKELDHQSFCAWFRSVFNAPDEHIKNRCGDDALQYLRFQRHIICYLAIIMVLSLGVILPLNLGGKQHTPYQTNIARTTMWGCHPGRPPKFYTDPNRKCFLLQGTTWLATQLSFSTQH